MSKYLGDFAAGDTIDFKFTTFRPSTGAAFTLAGSPAVSIYKSNSTTPSTTGVSLTVDFNSKTGLNHVQITTATGEPTNGFYTNGSQFEAVITAGTVDSVSVIGACVGRFTLAAQTIKAVSSAVTVGTINSNVITASSLDAGAAGEIADAVWDEAYSGHTTAGTFGKLMDILRKSNYVTESQAGSGTKTNTKFDTDLSGYADDFFNGQTLVFVEGTLAGQSSVIQDFTGSTGEITLDSPMTTAPATNNAFVILPIHVHPSEEIGQAVLDKRIGEAGRMPYVTASLTASTNAITGYNTYQDGDRVTPQSTAGGFTAGNTYYVRNGTATPTTFELATGSGSGTVVTPNATTTVVFMPIEERTVRTAMQYLRNRVNLASSTLTVYSENDTVASWTSSVSTSGTTTPITESNPVD